MLNRCLMACHRLGSTLIARLWIAPLEKLLWEMVGLVRSSPWCRMRSVLSWCKDLGHLLCTGFRVHVTRWDGVDWSIVYVSENEVGSSAELKHLFFSKPPTEVDLGWTFVWRVPAVVRSSVAQGYLAICDVNRLLRWQFEGLYHVRAYPWLRALMDVEGSTEQILGRMNRSRRRDLAGLEEGGFEYVTSRSEADLAHFYHRMYVPYVSERYHERARVASLDGQRQVLEKGGCLLGVKWQEAMVATCLGTVRRYGRTFSALFSGVDYENGDAPQRGVVVALYWHIINWTRDAGLSTVDFGRTRARLTDGLFMFKQRWGMRFERDITIPTMWSLVGEELPHPLIRHLNELGFVAQVGTEYRCVVFTDHRAALSKNARMHRQKMAVQAGLDGLLLLEGPGR